MKKLALILALFLIVPSVSLAAVDPVALAAMVDAKAGGFRNSKWGMTPEEVIAADGVVGEITKVLDETKIKVVGGTQERPIVTTYVFEKNELDRVKISIENIQSEKEAWAIFNPIVKELTKTYGKPPYKKGTIAAWNIGVTLLSVTNSITELTSYEDTRKELVTEQRSDGKYYTTEKSVGYGATGKKIGGEFSIIIQKPKIKMF